MNKVAIISFEFPPYHGGIANYSFSLAKYLVIRKQDLTILTINPNAISNGLFKVIRPIPRGAANENFPVNKLYSALYRLYQYFFLGINLIPIALNSDRIIITSLFFDLSFITIRFFRFFGVAYEIVLHGLDLHELSQNKSRQFHQAVLSADKKFVNSQFTASIAQEYFPGCRFHIFPPLLDTEKINQTPIIDRSTLLKSVLQSTDCRVIFSICRLVERKGLDIAVTAAIKFLAKTPHWVFVIAGEGEKKEYLQTMVPQELKSRIIFSGAISDREKYSYLTYSEVFIMPNKVVDRGDFEGFGISFIEASYFNNWVIGGKNGGAIEAIDEQTNGYLVATEKGDAANEILTILKSIDQGKLDLQRLKAGRKRVIDKYSLHSDWKI